MTEERKSERCHVKAWLYSYRDIKAEADDIARRIDDLRDSVMGPKSSHLTGMPSGGSGTDIMADYVAKMDQLLDNYMHQLSRLAERQEEIENSIMQLCEVERRLIRLRYFDNKKWNAVCADIGYEWAHTHRIHAQVLDKLITIIPR